MSTTAIILTAVAVLIVVSSLVGLRSKLKSSGLLGGERKKVLATGVAGQAVILSINPTGAVVNNVYYGVRLRLAVRSGAGEAYEVETTDMVPVTALSSISAGMTVAVKIDPATPTSVAVDWDKGVQLPAGTTSAGSAVSTPVSAGDLAAALHDPQALATAQQGSAAELLRTGQRATGYLKSFADSGQTVRATGRQVPLDQLDDPLFVLVVDLAFTPGMPPIEATVLHRVPRAVAPTLRIGMALNCAVDPADPTRRVAVDWAAQPGTFPPSAPSASGSTPYG